MRKFDQCDQCIQNSDFLIHVNMAYRSGITANSPTELSFKSAFSTPNNMNNGMDIVTISNENNGMF